jgi:hypothetical protein
MERKAGFEKNQRVLGDKKKDFWVAQHSPPFANGSLRSAIGSRVWWR